MADEMERVRVEFPGLACEAFPDNDDVTWLVKNVTLRSPYCCVEAEPVPPTVGYPRFRFILVREKDGPWGDVACYCLNQGSWQLLYTAPGAAEEWRTLRFDEPPPVE